MEGCGLCFVRPHEPSQTFVFPCPSLIKTSEQFKQNLTKVEMRTQEKKQWGVMKDFFPCFFSHGKKQKICAITKNKFLCDIFFFRMNKVLLTEKLYILNMYSMKMFEDFLFFQWKILRTAGKNLL